MPTSIPTDCRLESYDYVLPENRIAQHPADQRDASRLMVLDRIGGETAEATFHDLPDLLPPEALLVANNSKVIPARLMGTKPSGGKVEFLLLTPPPLLKPTLGPDTTSEAEVEGLLRASKSPRPGERINFAPELSLTVLERAEFGRSRVRLQWQGGPEALVPIIERLGAMPLPPYIRRPADAKDVARYQTVYANASKAGSVAAPTAGLHFTPEMRARLARAGFGWAEITLYVGYGTFSPVRCQDIREHRMHREYIEINEATARTVAAAKAKGRPVVAIGTTSARALEGMFQALGTIGTFHGETELFLRPGSVFHVVDALLTNFHLPKSSLLIMIAALAGRESVLRAYEQALTAGFRFFSYGDAMLIR